MPLNDKQKKTLFIAIASVVVLIIIIFVAEYFRRKKINSDRAALGLPPQTSPGFLGIGGNKNLQPVVNNPRIVDQNVTPDSSVVGKTAYAAFDSSVFNLDFSKYRDAKKGDYIGTIKYIKTPWYTVTTPNGQKYVYQNSVFVS